MLAVLPVTPPPGIGWLSFQHTAGYLPHKERGIGTVQWIPQKFLMLRSCWVQLFKIQRKMVDARGLLVVMVSIVPDSLPLSFAINR